MKKIMILVMIVSLFLASCTSEEESGKLRVVASFYPLYDFTSKLAGDNVELSMLVPQGVEPHDWEPTSKDIITLEKADLLILNGGSMELWSEDILESLSNKELKVVITGEGIDSLGEDSHYWLSPLLAKEQMYNIKTALVEIDNSNAAFYEANYSKWADELISLDNEYREKLENLSQREVVVSHEAFGYLCSAYNLEQVAIEGLSPDSEPDPSRMAEITRFVKSNGITTIFSEELVSDKVAQRIASETGAKVVLLSPLESIASEEEDYFSVMRSNLAKLVDALK